MIGGIRGTFHGADDVADLDMALESVERLRADGYTSACFKPTHFTDDPAELGDICRRVVAAFGNAIA